MASYSHTKIHITHSEIIAFFKHRNLPESSGPRADCGHTLLTRVLFTNAFVNKVLFECSDDCLLCYFSDSMSQKNRIVITKIILPTKAKIYITWLIQEKLITYELVQS